MEKKNILIGYTKWLLKCLVFYSRNNYDNFFSIVTMLNVYNSDNKEADGEKDF